MTTIFADDTKIEKRIYESFFSSLSESEKPLVYMDSKIESLTLASDKFVLTSTCKDADIVIMTKSSLAAECQDNIVFGTRYRHLRKEYVVGAFFWQKGRPNIVFQKEKLDEKQITLAPALQDFIE